MQTSLARRQRRRRSGRGASRASAVGRFAVILPMILLGSMALLGAITFVGAVDVYATYSRDLGDPRELLQSNPFNQQTILYDRTGTVQLAAYGSENRRVLTFQEIPNLVLDAHTTTEDKTFWTRS